MEDKFELVKKMWQTQTLEQLTDLNPDFVMEGVLARLSKFEKKQFRINVLKILAVVIFILFLAVRVPMSFFSISGLLLVVTGAVFFLTVYMQHQFKVSKLNLENDSLTLIDEAVEFLKRHLLVFKKYFWIFGLLLFLGINLIYFDVFRESEFSLRLIAHSVGSMMIVISYFGGMTIRKFRHKKEYIPVISELIEIKNDFLGENNE
ncbi:MAG: hypothetical protein ACEPO8_00945 [Rhodothermaceae bacterium]